MKKYILALLIGIACSAHSSAQLLWKITGNGLSNPSYLFGTHHMIPIAYLDSIPGLYKAYNSTKSVVGEILASNIEGSLRIQQAAVMPSHIRMKDLLEPNEYRMINQEMNDVLGFGLEDVGALSPNFLLTLYSLELYKKQTGYKETIPVDSYFQIMAEQSDRKIVGLETVEEQISYLFGNKDFERQADLLSENIKHKDKLVKDIEVMNSLYKKGNINELVKLAKGTGAPTDMTEAEYKKMVDNRNTAWLIKLPKLMEESSCFIAVGALHLGGSNGLIKQLQKAGYKVKAVKK